MSEQFFFGLRRLFTAGHRYLAFKVLAAISAVLGMSLALDDMNLAVLLSLGVVSGAIAETDDSLWGRVKNLSMTQACFLLATFSVQYLLPYPWLFALGLVSSSFLFVMVGTLGPRYATISFGALLLAISTLGAPETSDVWHRPLMLSAGGLWYGAVSLVALYWLPYKGLHEQLAECYFALSRYLHEKSRFFPADVNSAQTIGHNLAQLNINLVTALALTQANLDHHVAAGRMTRELAQMQHYYALAHALAERASASHYRYSELAAALAQTHLLDGFQEALLQLSEASQALGYALLRHQPYQAPKRLAWVVTALSDQLALWRHRHRQLPATTALTPAQMQSLSRALRFMCRNVRAMAELLNDAGALSRRAAPPLWTPPADVAAGAVPAAKPIRAQLATWPQALRARFSLDSRVFRHALRLSLGLLLGYGLMQFAGLEKGYWVMLTVLFVCQPSYSATRKRLTQRMLGTFLGIVLGAPLLWLLPNLPAQLLCMGLAVFLFFTQVRNNYSAAVCFITLFVLLAFNLHGNGGFAVLLPRLVDTALGGLLAYGLVALLWPDWQYRRLPGLISQALSANVAYLQAVGAQLGAQRSEQIDYVRVRQRALHADSELATAWQSMLVEPAKGRKQLDACYALTWHNHLLLSYISALGAHRDRLPPLNDQAPLLALCHTLQQAAGLLAGASSSRLPDLPEPPAATPPDEGAAMLAQQLTLLNHLASSLLAIAITPVDVTAAAAPQEPI
ncbi:MAG: YccS family putative transporter [Aeromonas sp.]